MNSLFVSIFACLVIATRAGYLGYSHGHLPVVGASGIVSSGGAAGPAGVVTGHGAIGPNGEHNSQVLTYGHENGYGHGYGYGHGHLPVVGASGVVSSGGAAGPAGVVTGHGAVGPNGEHNSLHGGLWAAGHGAWGHADDGQWHGEGLLASQDWAGHHGVPALALGHGHW